MTDDTIKLERVDIIHIPKRKENQTWPNYFIESLREQSVDEIVIFPDRVDDFVGYPEAEIIFSVRNRYPRIEIGLGYMAGDGLIDFKKVPSLEYHNRGHITIKERASSYILEFDDAEANIGAAYLPAEEWPGLKLPKDLVGEKVLYVLAEYIKKRQEEQK